MNQRASPVSQTSAPPIFPTDRPAWMRYAAAVVMVGLGWSAREAITPAIGPTALPFITFFPAVALTGWLCGLGPSLLALLLSTLAAQYAFIPPVRTFRLDGAHNVIALVSFVTSAIFIIVAIEAMHRAKLRLVDQIADLNRAQAESSEAREWLATTLASIGDGVIATDAEGRITLLNRVAETLTGWRDAEARGKPLDAVFRVHNEQTGQPVEDPVARVLREGTVVGLANHAVLAAKDGSERPIEDSAAPIKGDSNKIVGVVLVFRDATEQRRYEQLQQTYQADLERQVRERTQQSRAAEERFRLLIQGTREYAIFMLDPQGNVISWNPGAERIKGYRADEIIGQHFSRFYPPEGIAAGMPARELEIAATTGKYEEEGWRLRKDGSRFWASVVLTALHDEEGKLRGFSKVTRDMTERKQAEETARRLFQEETARAAAETHAAAIAAERERLKVTLKSIGDGVIATDAQGRVTMLNPVAESLTGWTQADAEGQPLSAVFRIINEFTRQPAEDPVAKVLASGLVVGLANHTMLIGRDGVERPIDDSAAPIHDKTGRISGVVLVFREISARKREEEERLKRIEQLAQAEERMRSVVNNVIDGIITIDERGCVQSFNPAAEKIFGYTSEEIVGQNVKVLMPEPYHGEHDGYIANYLRTGQAKIIGIGREVVGKRKDGTTFPMDLAIGEFHIGRTRSFTGIARDITERKRAEEALREADRRKTEFLATLSHELRNPLAPIRNAVELLRRASDDPSLLERVRGTIERQVAQMVRLVDDLLEISRITRGRLHVKKERIDLASVVQSAVEATRPLIDAAGHELIVHLPSEPIYLEADPTRLAQVLSNLLNNAARYTPSRGKIWLTVRRQDHEVIISVKDTGIGIAPEHLPQIFEMFSQVKPVLERSHGGLGIGLSLVRGLVELHEGRVEAHSAGLGHGSEFVIHLPIGAAAGPPDISAELELQPAGPRQRILVVDDNQDSAASLRMLLHLDGHDVHVAHDGAEAIEAALSLNPDVVLLDIGLPKLNGYEVAKRLRERDWNKRLVLIALTGWGQEEDRRRAMEAGFDHHLTKPVDPAALTRLLAGLNTAA